VKTEAALSPQRQLSFLKIIHDLEAPGHAQFIIASHSPILLAYPGATLYSFSSDGISEIAYRDTEHYRVTTDFLNAPERYLRYLFADDDQDEGDG
jgi:predicted ATPase